LSGTAAQSQNYRSAIASAKVQLHLQELDTGFPVSHQPKFYAAPNFLKMRINYPNLSSWTISTIKDEKSAAKFHYMKTTSGKVVAQSIAFRVVSIYWQAVAPFP